MENIDTSKIEDTPIIDTITTTDIALLQSLLIYGIELTNGYDPVRERTLRRLIIKLDKYM